MFSFDFNGIGFLKKARVPNLEPSSITDRKYLYFPGRSGSGKFSIEKVE
jgi:hypothetical protein